MSGSVTASDVESERSWNEQLMALALAVLVFHVVTVPWRVIASRSSPGNYSWSGHDRYWHLQWMPDRVLARRGAYYRIAGGGNTACKVEPKRCRKIARLELRRGSRTRAPEVYDAPGTGGGHFSEAQFGTFTKEVFRAHPVEWVRRRLELLPSAWFGSAVPGFLESRPLTEVNPQVPGDPKSHEIIQNGLFLAVLVALARLVRRAIRRWGPDLVTLVVPALVVAIGVPALALHYESRYLVPLKLVSVVALGACSRSGPGTGGCRRLRSPVPSPSTRTSCPPR